MWHIITEQTTNEDNISYTAYGFRCGEYEVHDFTSLQDEAENFLTLLNRMEVSPMHIYEVIEDHFAAV